MKPEEYKHAATYLTNTFPSLREWWSTLDDEQRVHQRERNRRCLMECDLRDVLTVIDELSKSADDPWPYSSDKERAAAIVAKRASEIRHKRNEANEANQPQQTRQRYRQDGQLKAVREAADELAELRKQPGWTDRDTKAWLESQFPSDPTDIREHYRCTACRDSGLVDCLVTIRRVGDRIVHKTGVAACPCPAGDRFSNRRDESQRLETFDDLRHCACRPNTTGDEAARLLGLFVKRREDAKRVGSFDDWNSRAEAIT